MKLVKQNSYILQFISENDLTVIKLFYDNLLTVNSENKEIYLNAFYYLLLNELIIDYVYNDVSNIFNLLIDNILTSKSLGVIFWSYKIIYVLLGIQL